MKFRKKPIIIEAIQYKGKESENEILDFLSSDIWFFNPSTGTTSIRTLEGWIKITDGDWIIKGIADEFYPCNPDIFEATYERIEDEVPES